MRPLGLRLHGFGAFTAATEVEFRDVDLFALTGPTGSGKTTVLDAICFALYGSVPRYGKNEVAPLISQGQIESNVVFTFSVGDAIYRAARRVRRNPNGRGASTGEAVLERDGEAIASSADGVTAAVERLLGLNFDQFTTCVLLPQGEFARFLHEKPAVRQELLTALLDLGIYERISNRATGRQRWAEGLLAQIDADLARFGELGAADLEVAAGRVKELVDLLAAIDERLPEIEALTQDWRRKTEQESAVEAARQTLLAVEPPTGWEEVGVESDRLTVTIEGLEQESRAVQARLLELNEQLAGQPSRGQLEVWIDAASKLDQTRADLEEAQRSLPELIADAEVASAEAVEAQADLARLIDADRAAHLRRNLAVGDTCPICGEEIKELGPPGKPGKDLAKAEKELAKTTGRYEKARRAAEEMRARISRDEGRVADLVATLTDSPPDRGQALNRLAATERQLEESRRQAAATETKLSAARQAWTDAGARREQLSSALDLVWDRIIELKPPRIDLGDPAQAWRSLLEWRSSRLPRLNADLETSAREVREALVARDTAVADLDATLDEANVDGTGRARDRVVATLERARTEHEKVGEALETTARLTSERDQAVKAKEMNRQLTLQLRTDRFRKWLFDEVFAVLVLGANRFLSELTQGRYELAMAGKEFDVVDHQAADHRRSARSLSGGETFLVSLALAIALAEEVATTAGAHGLESLFLDEGFGTLDAESLDVVSGVIAELGAAGKTVGIVTHVSELAEQMPVRYEVGRGSKGATISKVTG